MTAMRLKRYPSPSGGIALGKMGAGATMLRSILPAGARWVEYLESTGTQWLDTGVVATGSTVARIGFTPTGASSNSQFGSYNANGILFNFFVRSQNQTYFQLRGATILTTQTGAYNTRMDIELGNYYIKNLANDEIIVSGDAQGAFTADRTMKWFRYDRGNTTTGSGKIHFTQIIQDGTLVRDFRPIAIDTTGYLLDLVSGEYLPYGNAGTGNFVIGPGINAPAI